MKLIFIFTYLFNLHSISNIQEHIKFLYIFSLLFSMKK